MNSFPYILHKNFNIRIFLLNFTGIWGRCRRFSTGVPVWSLYKAPKQKNRTAPQNSVADPLWGTNFSPKQRGKKPPKTLLPCGCSLAKSGSECNLIFVTCLKKFGYCQERMIFFHGRNFMTILNISGGSRISQGRQSQGGANLLFDIIFTENCMKMKQIWLIRGRWIRHWILERCKIGTRQKRRMVNPGRFKTVPLTN